jgi:Flp pilus assembly protein protease CpaA
MDITTLLIGLLVFAIVCAVAYWIVTNLIPAPAQKWVFAVLLVILAIVLIKFLLGYVGGGALRI